MSPLDRRDVLRSALSVGVAAALGGCSALGDGGAPERQPYDVPERSSTPTRTGTPVVGTDPTATVNFEPVAIPDTGPAWYRKWLPPADALGSDQPLILDHFDLQALRAAGDAVPAGFDAHRRDGKLGLDYFGIGFENYRRLLRRAFGGEFAVVEGSFGVGTVADTLVTTGYAETGTHRGYRLFTREDGARAVAVADGELVWARAREPTAQPGARAETGRPSPPTEFVRKVVDARKGGPRFERRGLSSIASRGGGPAAGGLRLDDGSGLSAFDLDDAVGVGNNLSFGERPVFWLVVALSPPVDEAAIRESLREYVARNTFGREARSAEVTVGERSATMAFVPPTDAFSGRGARTYPQVTWGYDYDPGSETLTITHEAGDDIDPAHLDADGPIATPVFPDGVGTVSAGDEVNTAVDPEDDGVVVVWWGRDDDALRKTIGRFVLPDHDEGGQATTGDETTTGDGTTDGDETTAGDGTATGEQTTTGDETTTTGETTTTTE